MIYESDEDAVSAEVHLKGNYNGASGLLHTKVKEKYINWGNDVNYEEWYMFEANEHIPSDSREEAIEEF